MHRVLTRADIGLLVFLAIATLTAFPAADLAAGETDGTAVITGPMGTSLISLDEPGVYAIEGRTGEVTFAVDGAGRLSCTASSCDGQTCVRMGEVAAGSPVICAPNGVTAMLSVGKSGDLDAVSR